MRDVTLHLLLIAIAGVAVNGQELRWQNDYDKPLHFMCPTDGSINYIKSIHHNHAEDCLWDLSCKPTFDSYPRCSWSNYVNWFDEEFYYSCPGNSVMSGMYSYHENKQEDRRWKFYCCDEPGVCSYDCYWTNFVNNFDEMFETSVPAHYYLTGAGSYHDNGKEDRRWKYRFCTRSACTRQEGQEGEKGHEGQGEDSGPLA
ncbi:hemagglutinin/amebocyte aggregation factor-like [Erpetoichthys calabaricus]|uniref:Si:dkey-14d8.7 n=1 Tax=Erpetoichthys calabaricus TaxID=27687 RepID=A0A8C4XC77_ERPCA|nr:hemagglutinin/amebocyte aggregation factor-like [Erpetoichthys calabaricus]